MLQSKTGGYASRRGVPVRPSVDRTTGADAVDNPTPISINFHILKPCNARCDFCFATFRNVRERLPTADARRVIDRLRAAGGEKITFAGGEPTLHPDLGKLVEHAKRAGFVTGVVTNGSRLADLLVHHGAALNWVALSVDSAREETQTALGRGRGGHVERSVDLADQCRDRGVRVKLNTVVTALNWREDMSGLIRRIAPERWKVFQVLRVVGQNDGRVEPLLITPKQFRAFVLRHAHLAAKGYPALAEDNDAMIDSYVMVDPLGRFFGNTGGIHRTSPPILEVGVQRALASVRFDEAKFNARGGRYAW